jgi:hypothetical protein
VWRRLVALDGPQPVHELLLELSRTKANALRS